MAIVTRKLSELEQDLLLGNERKVLFILDLCGDELERIAPDDNWTHDKLEAINYDQIAPFGWEAYLEGEWIGGSEV